MRFAVLTKMCLAAAAAALLVAPASPAQAQQYSGSRNARVSTVGDISGSKINLQIRGIPGLNFSTMGLFGDAEVYSFKQPRPYIFPLPELGISGTEFKDMTYQEYLDTVAGRYSISDSEEYLNRFSYLNKLSYNGDLLFPESSRLLEQYNSVIEEKRQSFRDQFGVDDLSSLPDDYIAYINGELQNLNFALIQSLESQAVNAIHEDDFLAGGGYLTLPGEGTTPTPSTGPIFTPLPDDPVIPVNTDTNEVLNSITEQDPAAGQAVEDILAAQSSSQDEQQAPAVAVVPEPATLALMTLGAAAGLIRPRRR